MRLANTAKKLSLDERAHARKELGIDISLEGDHNFFTGLAKNISAGGVFVATHELHEIGAQVRLKLTLPEHDRPIVTTGRVAWVRPHNEANDAPTGVGIKFAELAPEDEAAILEFIEQRPPIFFE